mgnify:CR=1 FL=1
MSFLIGSMNQKLWSCLTITALTLSTLGIAPTSFANQSANPPGVDDEDSAEVVSQSQPQSDQIVSTAPQVEAEAAALDEVAKVGEYQSHEATLDLGQEAIAIIQPHELNGRQAATLYVNNIPVLTFLGDQPFTSTPEATAQPRASALETTDETTDVKVGSPQTESPDSQVASAEMSATALNADPVIRAAAIAAQINQLHQNQVDPEQITVRWDDEQSRFLIEVNGEELVEVNENIILPDSTGDLAQDALQITNRLRRLMGGAPPLDEVAGLPRPSQHHAALGPVQALLNGVASWYGPGFHGNRSASGEVFDQNALTAAHRTLPFGTMVRVTNLNNGLSVVVRITDRGPFSRGRIIDLSAGAARVIGLISSGVAPVNVEVLGSSTASAY